MHVYMVHTRVDVSVLCMCLCARMCGFASVCTCFERWEEGGGDDERERGEEVVGIIICTPQ